MTYDETPQELIDFCMRCEMEECPGICLGYIEYAERLGVEVPRAIIPPRPRINVRELRRSYTTRLDGKNTPLRAFGETHTMKEWSDKSGMRYHTLYMRVRSGYDLETALTMPVREQHQGSAPRAITALGRTMSVKQWAEETGLPYSTISTRLWIGWSPEDAVTYPSLGRGGNWIKKKEATRDGCES